MRKNLAAWQWADYPQKHRDPVNLRLHIAAVPMFWLGTALVIASIVEAEIFCALGGVILCAASMVIQGATRTRAFSCSANATRIRSG